MNSFACLLTICWVVTQGSVPVLLPPGAWQCGHWDCQEKPHHGLPLSNLHPCQCSSTQVSKTHARQNQGKQEIGASCGEIFPPTLLISPGNLKKIENLWKFKYQRQKFPFRNWLIETLKYDLSWFIRSNLVSSRSCISFLGTKRQLNQTPPWDWSSGNATNTFESRWPTSYLPPGRSHNWKYWT